MGFRVVEISRPAELHINKGILLVEQKAGTVSIPIEDIATLVFHGPAIRSSTMALSMLSEENIQIVFCNNKSMPVSMLAP